MACDTDTASSQKPCYQDKSITMETVVPIQVSESPLPAEAVFDGVAGPLAPPLPQLGPQVACCTVCTTGGGGGWVPAWGGQGQRRWALGLAETTVRSQALTRMGPEGPAGGWGLSHFPSFLSK